MLGAFLGDSEYIKNNLHKKITQLNKEKKNIIKYPHIKNRYLLTKFCFIAKFNYIFRTQYPWDTQSFLNSFDEMQGEIALSLFNEDLDHFEEDMTMFVGEATKLSTRLGGLGLRHQHLTLLSAFISSITSCVYELSKTFPSYIQTGGPERNFSFYGFSDVNRQLNQQITEDDFIVKPTDPLTAAIVGTAKVISEESDEDIFTKDDIKNANSILNKLLNILKSINYNDLDNYNHFHDTSTKKTNQLQSHT